MRRSCSSLLPLALVLLVGILQHVVVEATAASSTVVSSSSSSSSSSSIVTDESQMMMMSTTKSLVQEQQQQLKLRKSHGLRRELDEEDEPEDDEDDDQQDDDDYVYNPAAFKSITCESVLVDINNGYVHQDTQLRSDDLLYVGMKSYIFYQYDDGYSSSSTSSSSSSNNNGNVKKNRRNNNTEYNDMYVNNNNNGNSRFYNNLFKRNYNKNTKQDNNNKDSNDSSNIDNKFMISASTWAYHMSGGKLSTCTQYTDKYNKKRDKDDYSNSLLRGETYNMLTDQVYYVGPVCSSNGKGSNIIEMGIFQDSNCLVYVSGLSKKLSEGQSSNGGLWRRRGANGNNGSSNNNKYLDSKTNTALSKINSKTMNDISCNDSSSFCYNILKYSNDVKNSCVSVAYELVNGFGNGNGDDDDDGNGGYNYEDVESDEDYEEYQDEEAMDEDYYEANEDYEDENGGNNNQYNNNNNNGIGSGNFFLKQYDLKDSVSACTDVTQYSLVYDQTLSKWNEYHKKAQTPNPKPQTPNPKPQTPNP